VRVRKEMQVWIERELVLALERYHDDEPFRAHSAQLRYGGPNVEHMLEHMSTNDRVEKSIRERQRFDGRFDEVDRRMTRFGVPLDNEINAIELDVRERRLSAQEIDEVARAATHVDGSARKRPRRDRIEARLGIIRIVLDSRHPLVDAAIGFGRQARDALSKPLEIVDEATPVQPEQPAHETRVAQRRRQPFLEHVPDFVNGFATH
jgi:hypothetical protein